MTTVVLGWDGLDYGLATEWGVADRFAPHHCEIETIDNPVIGKPHTQELWPAIITGRHPRETGIRAAREDSGATWDSALVDTVSSLAAGVVPNSVRTAVGRRLLNHGVELNAERPDTYTERGLETVFDGRDAVPLAIPNYRTEIDDRLDLDYDRGAQLAAYLTLTTDEDGSTRHEPSVPLPTLERRLAAEASEKLGIVETSLHRDPDLVFAWLGYLDTVGHLAPTADEDWHRRHYRQASRWTSAIRDVLDPGDDLVVVADHGLRDGEHTHSAFFGATNASAVETVRSVLDVASAIERCTDSTATEAHDGTNHSEAAAVRENLEDLGYI